MKKITGILVVLLLCCILVIPANAEDTGSIYVTSEPSGAQVWIDWVLQDAVTPHTFEGIPVGPHEVRVYLEGYGGEPAFLGGGVDVIRDQTSSIHFDLGALGDPKIIVTNYTYPEQNFGKFTILSVDFFPEASSGQDTNWYWFISEWNNKILHLWYYTGTCANDNGEDGIFPPDYQSFYCEEPTPGSLVFHVLAGTPAHTITTVLFQGLFVPRNWGQEGWGAVTVEEAESVEIPEYPSPSLPATLVIGFLGTVFLIKRTREH